MTLARLDRRERWAWIALLALAFVLRFAMLGDRPPHHDEAIHCDFGYNLLTQGTYRYDPTYHGPLLYYVLAPLFAVFGATTGVARIFPSLCGVALVALPFFLRRRLGAATAFWSGAVLAISPIFVYYSRFAREDMPVSFFTAAAAALFLLVRRYGWRPIPWIAVAVAGHATSKETIYVTIPLVALAAMVVGWRRGTWDSVRRAAAWIDRYRVAIGTGLLWFFIICMVSFTVFFVHPEDALFPMKAIQYWYSQHVAERVGGPWWYHLPRLALYEFLILGSAATWAVRRRNRLTDLEVFCLAWGVGSIALYAYLGEKTPWLEVHQVLPFVPLAGAQLGRTFSTRGRWWSRGLVAVGIAGTLWSTLASSFLYPTISTNDPHAELIIYVQTTREEQELARLGLALAQVHKEGTVAAVGGEGTWPLSWQWKKVPVWWALPEPGMKPPLVVCDPDQEGPMRERLGAGYKATRIPMRAWWVEDIDGLTPGKVLHWFFTRRAWSGIGATDVVYFEANGAG